jgi:hypothetical protein
MTDEQIQRIQDEIMSSIQSETDIEDTIKNTAREIAARLTFNDKISSEFIDTLYMFKYRKIILPGAKQGIMMLIANMVKYQQFKEKYRPYTVTVEIDNNFTFRENLQAVLEAFFRHMTGRTQAEMLE